MSLIRRTWGAIRRAWDAWNRWWIRRTIPSEFDDLVQPAADVAQGGLGFVHFIRALFRAIFNQ